MGRVAIDILRSPAHRASAMHLRPVSIALVAVTLIIAPGAACPKSTSGSRPRSVHYGNTPPARTKNVRLVGMDSGTVSVVPGMSKEEKARLREREDQLRLHASNAKSRNCVPVNRRANTSAGGHLYRCVCPGLRVRATLASSQYWSREAAPGTSNCQTKATPPDAAHRGAKRPSYTDRSPPALGLRTTATTSGGRDRLALGWATQRRRATLDQS